MNSYELYLKTNFTEKEIRKQKIIKKLIDFSKNDLFDTWKCYLVGTSIALLAATFLLTTIIYIGSKGVTIMEILLNIPIIIIFLSGITLFFLFLILTNFERILSLKKNNILDMDEILQKPDFLSFLQKKIQEFFNFDIQKNFIKDFENAESNEMSEIIDFISKHYDKAKKEIYFYPFIKQISCEERKYHFKSKGDWMDNKYLLIKLLALIDLNEVDKEKIKNLSKELKKKLNELKIEEAENFFKSFKI